MQQHPRVMLLSIFRIVRVDGNFEAQGRGRVREPAPRLESQVRPAARLCHETGAVRGDEVHLQDQENPPIWN